MQNNAHKFTLFAMASALLMTGTVIAGDCNSARFDDEDMIQAQSRGVETSAGGVMITEEQIQKLQREQEENHIEEQDAATQEIERRQNQRQMDVVVDITRD